MFAASNPISPSSQASADDRRLAAIAPYLEAVLDYALRRPVRFTVPGHRGGHGADAGVVAALGLGALQCDVPRDIAGIDLGDGSPFERAQLAAARAHGAGRSWFLTNGATQGNHALCLVLAARGERVLVQRNAHGSVLDGLVLSGGRPAWIAPGFDASLGAQGVVSPAALAEALRAELAVTAVFLVAPTCAVPVAAAVGRIAAEVVAAYPPGIPAIVPGERVTTAALRHLQEARRHGARMHGAADGELRTIRCVEESGDGDRG